VGWWVVGGGVVWLGCGGMVGDWGRGLGVYVLRLVSWVAGLVGSSVGW